MEEHVVANILITLLIERLKLDCISSLSRLNNIYYKVANNNDNIQTLIYKLELPTIYKCKYKYKFKDIIQLYKLI